MQRVALILIVLSAFALSLGCARKPAALLGPWQVDVDKTLADLRTQDQYKKLPEEQQKRMDEAARERMSSTTFAFTETKMTLKSGPMSEDIDYKITAQDGDKWTVETTERNKKSETVTLVWADNDHISLALPPGQGGTIYLIRKTGSAEPATGSSPSASGAPATAAPPGETPGGSDNGSPTAGESRRPLRERVKEKIKTRIP